MKSLRLRRDPKDVLLVGKSYGEALAIRRIDYSDAVMEILRHADGTHGTHIYRFALSSKLRLMIKVRELAAKNWQSLFSIYSSANPIQEDLET